MNGGRPIVVSALVYDINDSNTMLPDKLVVDSNAWLFSFYSPLTVGNKNPNAIQYSDYVGRCFTDGNCTLVRSGFSFPEIAHVIEKCEIEARNSSVGTDKQAKALRRESTFRRKVLSEVVRTWRGIEEWSIPSLGLMVDADLIADVLVDFGRQRLDGYDHFIAREATNLCGGCLLTDDADYLSVPGLRVYTSNRSALIDAKATGRLRT